MSVLFDCLWWWRAEFGGKSNPYVESEQERTTTSSNTGLTEMPTATTGHQSMSALPELDAINEGTLPSLLLDASEIPDWNWEEFGDLDFNWC
jgi:hypothetical protein